MRHQRSRSRTLLIAVLVVWCALAGPNLRAFQQAPTPQVYALVDAAGKASAALRFDEALARIDEAIALAERTGDRPGLAAAFHMKGRVYRSKGAAKEAMPFLERGLKEYEAIGDKRGMASSLATMTTAVGAIGDEAKIREFSGRAAQLYDELGDELGRAWLDITLWTSTTRAVPTAGRIEAIADIARRFKNDDLLADALMFKANQAFARSDYASAVVSYQAAIQLKEGLPALDDLASAYVSLGRAFRAQGDFKGALAQYQRAIDILAPTTERYAIVEATNAASVALSYLNRPHEAVAMSERGLALARESGNPRLIDFMEGNLAGDYIDLGDWDRAIPLLEAAIAKKPEPSLMAYRQSSLAVALARAGRGDAALPPIDEAIRYSREAALVDLLAHRLDVRADVLKRLGRFDDALIDVREELGLLEQIRTRVVPSDYIKRGYADSVQASYRHGVDILFVADRPTEALEFAEQGRARAFLDLLADRESTPGEAIATRGVDSSGTVRSNALGKPLDLKGIERTARRLNSTVLEYSVGEDATLIWVVRPDAALASVRVPVGSKKLGELVAATTAALRETSNPTDVHGTGAVESAPAGADDLLALPMRGLGLKALAKDDRRAWRELYAALIEPVRAHLPARGSRMTIVPHGPLFELSFAALQNAAGRYLLEDYELHYAPSASVLDFTGRREQDVIKNTGPWAVVGNPATLPIVSGRPLPPLPGAAQEIAAIVAIAPRGSVVRLDGARADEAALERALEALHPSVLHFATHGFVFDDAKTQPFLALNRHGTSPADDGRLTMDEVYGLRLETDLVVLSACRSGSGQIGSDGVIGLTRGFFYAGSPSVLATFWDVVDDATTSLMTRFYRQYAKQHAKGASLHAAQLALLNDLRAGRITVTVGGRKVVLPEHPLLWAAFFLSGEP